MQTFSILSRAIIIGLGTSQLPPLQDTPPITIVNLFVTTLTLGSRPKQRVARVWVKNETRESHHILLGVQRVWGHEPSHSQVNSDVGSWSPEWTPKSSEHNFRGQNFSPRRVLYIIGKLLKCKFLKWAHIAHLNICNTSYGQKKIIGNLTLDH
jgi:hypothetical protein